MNLFNKKPKPYTPAYRDNLALLGKDTVRYQPEGTHILGTSYHSDTCDCCDCINYRAANRWTPRWWKKLIDEGKISLDYVDVNMYPYPNGEYGTGDRVYHNSNIL